MIEALEDLAGDNGVEFGEIADHAAGGVDLAADGDLDGVVVAVSVRIIALAVGGAVLRPR